MYVGGWEGRERETKMHKRQKEILRKMNVNNRENYSVSEMKGGAQDFKG